MIRTFAPFVAGIGSMTYPTFLMYNVIGAILWVVSLVLAGFWFGSLPIVKDNFSLVIVVIIALSLLPAIIELWRARRQAMRSMPGQAGSPN
jgi:membrane-associated protein